jgi:hypothetical protein
MATKISHRAKIFFLDLTISAMNHTRRNNFLSAMVRQTYKIFTDGRLIIWGGAILASAVSGFLIGYLTFFLIPR